MSLDITFIISYCVFAVIITFITVFFNWGIICCKTYNPIRMLEIYFTDRVKKKQFDESCRERKRKLMFESDLMQELDSPIVQSKLRDILGGTK